MPGATPVKGFRHAAKRFPLLRHIVEMYVAMQVGMAAGPFVVAALCSTSVGELAREHGVRLMLVMALSMTAPMVAWMRHRGHSWRNAGEMAAVMIAPALPLLGLSATGLVGRAVCGIYCAVATAGMVLLIAYRRNEFQRTKEWSR